MKIDVIILTDSSDVSLTQRTINTLHDSEKYFIFNIHVVDSGTDDPSKYNGFHNYIHPESNFNYNKFLNIAFNYCINDWVVISNDDVLYERWWFSEIMKIYSERNDIESFSPRDPVLYAKYYPTHFVGTPSKYFESYNVTEFLEGWCLAIKKTALDKIIPFDEDFDMYYQDNDYAERLKDFGIKHALVRYSVALHMNSLNANEIISKEKIDKLKIDEIKFRTKWNQLK
jgi:GT2 family glycosyltransferase